jgi:hypothetical protein
MEDNNSGDPKAEAAIQKAPEAPSGPARCPHCLRSPAKITMATMNFGLMQGAVFSCGHDDCRKLFNVQILSMMPMGQQASMVQPPPPGFRPRKM